MLFSVYRLTVAESFFATKVQEKLMEPRHWDATLGRHWNDIGTPNFPLAEDMAGSGDTRQADF